MLNKLIYATFLTIILRIKETNMKANNYFNQIKALNLRSKSSAALWFIMGVLFVFLLSTSIENFSNTKINSVDIEIDDVTGNHFLTSESVESFVKEYFRTDNLDLTIGELNLKDLEWVLEAHPYIESSDLFVDNAGNLIIKVQQKYPIVRVISNDGENFYLSNLGDQMPFSDKYTARVPIITGNYYDTNAESEAEALSTPFELAKIIKSHKVLNALVEQIHFKKNNEIYIIPKVGSFKIKLGDSNNLAEKMKQVLVVYKELVSNAGNKYKTLDVSVVNPVYASEF